MLPNEGKKKIIESYLNNNEIYVGIWSNSLYNFTNIFSLEDVDHFEISNYLGYERHKITKGKWSLSDAANLIYSTTDTVDFEVEEDWEALTGFFLATTNDASGKLLSLVKFEDPINIDIGNLSEKIIIQPSIKLL